MTDTYRLIPVTSDTSVEEVMIEALKLFGLDSSDLNRYRLVEVSLDKGCESLSLPLFLSLAAWSLMNPFTHSLFSSLRCSISCPWADNGQSRSSMGHHSDCCKGTCVGCRIDTIFCIGMHSMHVIGPEGLMRSIFWLNFLLSPFEHMHSHRNRWNRRRIRDFIFNKRTKSIAAMLPYLWGICHKIYHSDNTKGF